MHAKKHLLRNIFSLISKDFYFINNKIKILQININNKLIYTKKLLKSLIRKKFEFIRKSLHLKLQ